MSYTFPPPNAVDLSWSGATAFTHPAPNAVVLEWSSVPETVEGASGFLATVFGQPSTPFVAKSFETGVPTLEYALTEIDGADTTGSFVTRAPNGTWLVGTRTASDSGAVATSADAVSWVVTSVSRNHDAAIRPSDGKCVLPAFGAFRSSTNYTTWATETVTGYETVDMASVCWTGSNFRAIGSDWDCFGSTGDGTWTRIAATGIVGFFSGARIRSGNGVLLACTSSGGTLRISTNGGSSWSSVTSQFGTSGINELHYDAATATWMAVGSSGKVSISTDDGANWTARNTGTTSALYGVSKVGSKWVVVGAGGVVLESEDTIAWDVSSGAFGSKIVRAIGASGDEAVLYADGALISHATTNAEGERVSLMGDFGVPETLASQVAQGVRSIRFGRPRRIVPPTVFAPWVPSTSFGVPQIGFIDAELEVANVLPTAWFGWPRGGDFVVPEVPEVLPGYVWRGVPHGSVWSKFGTPQAAYDATLGASGWYATEYGVPERLVNCFVEYFALIRFGGPSAVFDQTGSVLADGYTDFGRPLAIHDLVGVHAAWSSVYFGEPVLPVCVAQSFRHQIRFGIPFITARNYRAYSIQSRRRFGNPRMSQVGLLAAPITVAGFGAPEFIPPSRATHIWPQSRFGQPSLIRGAQC